jgi:hypothetical protein
MVDEIARAQVAMHEPLGVEYTQRTARLPQPVPQERFERFLAVLLGCQAQHTTQTVQRFAVHPLEQRYDTVGLPLRRHFKHGRQAGAKAFCCRSHIGRRLANRWEASREAPGDIASLASPAAGVASLGSA